MKRQLLWALLLVLIQCPALFSSAGSLTAAQIAEIRRRVSPDSPEGKKAIPRHADGLLNHMQPRQIIIGEDIQGYKQFLNEAFDQQAKSSWTESFSFILKTIRVNNPPFTKEKIKELALKLLQHIADNVLTAADSALVLEMVTSLDQNGNKKFLMEHQHKQMFNLYKKLCAFNKETEERPAKLTFDPIEAPQLLEEQRPSTPQLEERAAAIAAARASADATGNAMADSFVKRLQKGVLKKDESKDITLEQMNDELTRKTAEDLKRKEEKEAAKKAQAEAEKKRIEEQRKKWEEEEKLREEERKKKEEEEAKHHKVASRKKFSELLANTKAKETNFVDPLGNGRNSGRKSAAGSVANIADRFKEPPASVTNNNDESNAQATAVPETTAQATAAQATAQRLAKEAEDARERARKQEEAQLEAEREVEVLKKAQEEVEARRAHEEELLKNAPKHEPDKKKKKNKEPKTEKKHTHKKSKEEKEERESSRKETSGTGAVKKLTQLTLLGGTAVTVTWLIKYIKDHWDTAQKLFTFRTQKIEHTKYLADSISEPSPSEEFFVNEELEYQKGNSTVNVE